MGKIVDSIFSSAKMVIIEGWNKPHFGKENFDTATQILWEFTILSGRAFAR